MADITKTPVNVRPAGYGNDCMQNLKAGEALQTGDAVYVNSASPSQVLKARGNAIATVRARGVVIKGDVNSTPGSTLIALNEVCVVLYHGELHGFDLTGVLGNEVYVSSAVAGNLTGTKADITAGQFEYALGWASTDENGNHILTIQPQILFPVAKV